MGLRDRLRGKKVYFDANVFICLVEGFAAFQAQLAEIRDSLMAGEAYIFTSELTVFEVLVLAGLEWLYLRFLALRPRLQKMLLHTASRAD